MRACGLADAEGRAGGLAERVNGWVDRLKEGCVDGIDGHNYTRHNCIGLQDGIDGWRTIRDVDGQDAPRP